MSLVELSNRGMEFPIKDDNFVGGGINQGYVVPNVSYYQGQYGFQENEASNVQDIGNKELKDNPVSNNAEMDGTQIYQQNLQHFKNVQHNLDLQVIIEPENQNCNLPQINQEFHEPNVNQQIYNPNISHPNDQHLLDYKEPVAEEVTATQMFQQMYSPNGDSFQDPFHNAQEPIENELKEPVSDEVASNQVYEQIYQSNSYQEIPEPAVKRFQEDIDDVQQPLECELKEEPITEEVASIQMYQQNHQLNSSQQNHQSNVYQEIHQLNDDNIEQPFNNAQQPVEHEVKEEPATDISPSQAYQQIYPPNDNNWQQISGNAQHIYQPNQAVNDLSNADPQVKREPPSENETVGCPPKYEQMPNQNVNNWQLPFQPNPGFIPPNPFNFQANHPAFNPGLVHPNPSGQLYAWNSFWNNYGNIYGNGFPGQMGWPQYNLQQNAVKTEPDISNDETSDLGSSFNTTGSSEESFDFTDDKSIKPVNNFRGFEDIFDWVPDDKILPKGWRKRVYRSGKASRHHFFLSPSNQKFTSKTAVAEYMEKHPHIYSKEDVDKIKTVDGVKIRQYTNWENSDPTLPHGWFKRQTDYRSPDGRLHVEYQYLSPDKQTFSSRNAVAAYMETSNFYTDQDIRMVLSGKVRRKPKEEKEKKSSGVGVNLRNYTEWDNSDPTLPQGWCKRHSAYRSPDGKMHTEYQYLSPNQEKFNSRNAVASFMSISGTYTEEDIQRVLSGKGHGRRSQSKPYNMNGKLIISTNARDYTPWDDSDQTLPEGWLKRQSDYKYSDGRLHTEYQYLSPDKQKFTSRNMATAFMKSSGLYSEEVIGFFLSGRAMRKPKNYM